jgi:hypothetical protein
MVFLLAVAALATTALSQTCSCPFCSMQGQTLTGEVGQATMVVYGDLGNAKDNGDGTGTTDLLIETVIKPHKKCEGQKKVTLERYIPPEGRYRYLVFCDVFKDKVDPYKVVAVQKDCDMAKYLQGALERKDEPVGKRLRFFFDYLDNADLEISNDAYKEFANADYKDYRDMARDVPAERVVKWLKDDKTPAFRFGLYASMLGHCGTKKDAAVLRELLDNPVRRAGSGVDGMLAGYVMLDAGQGWPYVRQILQDGKKEFMLRYAALRAVRFLWDNRPDLVAHKDLKEGAAGLLEQADIADLAIDDLRKWSCWDMADRVLGVLGKPPGEVPIVRRAILRFCLSCKASPAAERYVAEQRKKDAQAVADVEELLKLEQTPPAAASAK